MKSHGLLVRLIPACLVAAWLLVTAGPVLAQGEVSGKFAAPAPPEVVTIYTAKKILTMEPSNPAATAVAVYHGTLPDNTPKGLTWTTKYGMVGMTAFNTELQSKGNYW